MSFDRKTRANKKIIAISVLIAVLFVSAIAETISYYNGVVNRENSTIASLSTQIANQNNEITNLNSQIANLTSQVSNLNVEITNLTAVPIP